MVYGVLEVARFQNFRSTRTSTKRLDRDEEKGRLVRKAESRLARRVSWLVLEVFRPSLLALGLGAEAGPPDQADPQAA